MVANLIGCPQSAIAVYPSSIANTNAETETSRKADRAKSRALPACWYAASSSAV
jgi:hypothetical protein